MSDLDLKDLLNKKWPLVELGEIANVISGKEVTSIQLKKQGTPAIKSGDLSGIKRVWIDSCCSFVDESELKEKKYAESGDILMVNGSGSFKVVGNSYIYRGKEKALIGGTLCYIKHKQNAYYLVSVINSNFFKKQIWSFVSKKATKGMPFSIGINNLKTLKIPLPPIEVQNKIADFLEKFDELENRQIQLGFYQDLLILKQGYEFFPLSEIITEFISGKEVTHQQINDSNGEGIPCVKAGDINSSKIPILYEFKRKVLPNLIQKIIFAEKGDILISDMGDLETIGSSSVYFGEEKIITGQHIKVLKHQQNPKYLAFALNTKDCKKQKKSNSTFGTVAGLKTKEIKKLEIPLPSIETQTKIGEFLGKLSALVSDIKTGIPAEINLRRKQFEYYREALISG